MTTRLIIALICVTILLVVNYQQRQTIAALIELNHDKSVYIDSGCYGRYEGAEEFLSSEKR